MYHNCFSDTIFFTDNFVSLSFPLVNILLGFGHYTSTVPASDPSALILIELQRKRYRSRRCFEKKVKLGSRKNHVLTWGVNVTWSDRQSFCTLANTAAEISGLKILQATNWTMLLIKGHIFRERSTEKFS